MLIRAMAQLTGARASEKEKGKARRFCRILLLPPRGRGALAAAERRASTSRCSLTVEYRHIGFSKLPLFT